MHFYVIFGLIIKSEIALPEAECISKPLLNNVDVDIGFGKPSFDLASHPKTHKEGLWLYCFPENGRFSFQAEGIEFEVLYGKQIKIFIHDPDYSPVKLHTFLLGTAFGVLGIQRGRIPIHGAAVADKNRAFIISGYSSAGKSTMLEVFLTKGYRYLSDDVSMITTENGFPEVLPAYPQRKLAIDAASSIECCTKDLLRITEDNRDKYLIRRTNEWCPERLPLCGLTEIYLCSDAVKITPVHGHEALELILRNLYRRIFYRDIELAPTMMKSIFSIAKTEKIMKIARPISGLSPVTLANQIESNLFF